MKLIIPYSLVSVLQMHLDAARDDSYLQYVRASVSYPHEHYHRFPLLIQLLEGNRDSVPVVN